MTTSLRFRSLLLSGACIAVLAGCGGSQDTPPAVDSSTTATAEPQPVVAGPATTTTPVVESPAAGTVARTGAVSEAAIKYDNQIVHQHEGGRGKDDGWFLVKEGKRRWITDDQWPGANGYDPYKVIYITSEEFYSIPEDPRPLPNPDEAPAK